MGLFNVPDELGKAVEAKRAVDKSKDNTKEEAKEEAKQEQQRHEEDKKQGMI